MPFVLKNNANTQSHCHREELTMQNAHTRRNPTLYSVLAFSMLASTATPVWADDDQQAVRYGTYSGAVAGAAASAATVATVGAVDRHDGGQLRQPHWWAARCTG